MKMALFPKSDIFDILATFVKKPILAILGPPPFFGDPKKGGGHVLGDPSGWVPLLGVMLLLISARFAPPLPGAAGRI